MPITNRHRPMTDEKVELWEAFGVMPPDRHRPEPTVRRDMRTRVITYRDYDGLDPESGVHYVRLVLPDGSEISAHGDDTTGVFVKVHGLSADHVTAMYQRVERAVPAFLDAIWRPLP